VNICWNVWKEPCRGCGFVAFVTFRGARQAEGRQHRSRRAPTGSDQSYADRRPRGGLPSYSELTCKKNEGTSKRFFDILGFAKKTKKIYTVWQKPRNVTKFKIVTLWHLEMSPNVTLFQIFGTNLHLPFMFGSGSERLSVIKYNLFGPILPRMQFNTPMNHGKILKGWPPENALRNYGGTKHFQWPWTGGASDIIKAQSSGEDPRGTGGLVSNLPHPRVNKTKQHTMVVTSKWKPKLDFWFLFFGLLCHHTASESITADTHTSGTQ